jgi:flagellar basal-body rod modification protein FlgD
MTIAATAAASTSAATGNAATTAAAASNTLAGNFNTFLTLLTTQLQNQDPTSPLDTNQFTSQLVEFASVEQQINTNTNLGTLIGLSQAGALTQSAAMVGHQVSATSGQLALQAGSAQLQYMLAAAQPVSVTVTDTSGVQVYQTNLAGAAGNNRWAWNGTASDGTVLPDGLYNVSVTTAGSTPVAVPFGVVGTVTGVTMNGATPTVALGPLSVPMSAVNAVVN